MDIRLYVMSLFLSDFHTKFSSEHITNKIYILSLTLYVTYLDKKKRNALSESV